VPSPPPSIPEGYREKFCEKVVKRLKEEAIAHNKTRSEVLEKIKEDYGWQKNKDGTFVVYVKPSKSKSVVEVDLTGRVTGKPVEWEPALVETIVRSAAQEILQEYNPVHPHSSPAGSPRPESKPISENRGKQTALFGALTTSATVAAIAADRAEQEERRRTLPGQPESKRVIFAKVFKVTFIAAAVAGAALALTALIGGPKPLGGIFRSGRSRS
jgi:hypothetical protein